MIQIEWDKVITVLIAVYGAVLSSYNLYISLKEKRRRVKIEIDYGHVRDQSGPISPTTVTVTAANIGDRTVTLTSAGIQLPNKSLMFWMDPTNSTARLPHELIEGKNHIVWVEAEKLAQELQRQNLSRQVKVRGFYKDALGTTYKSKPFKFSVDEWLKPQK